MVPSCVEIESKKQRNATRLQVKIKTNGLCRRTEPTDANEQMTLFLESGVVPVLSYRASREKIKSSLSQPVQAVKTGLMDVATAILYRVVGTWDSVDQLITDMRGTEIDRHQAEGFILRYLEHHKVPGKLQVRWVKHLNCGGRLQECGRRGEPTSRQLRLWINSGFAGIRYAKSLRSFVDHEICTHALRAINDRTQESSKHPRPLHCCLGGGRGHDEFTDQVWANNRQRYGLFAPRREYLSTEEGLATLNSVLCYPTQQRHLWSAAMLYYCAVKGQEMGFRELHDHLGKYIRSPTKRYWYCIKTKGGLAEMDKPGACGKGQVYLEGAVDILRALDAIDFELLYSGRVPFKRLSRIKNIVRPSLVTLPRFVQDKEYRDTLRQIGCLNGIISPNLLYVVPKQPRLGSHRAESKSRCLTVHEG